MQLNAQYLGKALYTLVFCSRAQTDLFDRVLKLRYSKGHGLKQRYNLKNVGFDNVKIRASSNARYFLCN